MKTGFSGGIGFAIVEGGQLSEEIASRGRTLFVVDDDPAIRRALARLARAVGYGAETFGSAEEFLADPPPLSSQPGCILLDVSLPGLSGPELHHRLRNEGWDVPVIYVTAHDDERTRDAIADTDAAATFAKPIEVAALLDLIGVLFERLERSNKEGRAESSVRAPELDGS
jgi:FixJ family two-component response regulator